MQSSDVGVGDQILAAQYNNLRLDGFAWMTGASVEVTISSGVITITSGKTFYRVDTEGDGAADDLDSISGGAEGSIVILIAEDITRVVTIKDSASIYLNDDSDLELDAANIAIVLIKLSSGSWMELSRTSSSSTALPSGVIGLFDDTCPAGWTRFAALDGLFPRGASSYGGTGGADTHTHTIATVPAHTHAAGTLAGASDGAHTHNFTMATGWGNSARLLNKATGTSANLNTSTSSNYAHTFSGSVANGGTVGAVTDSESSLPPYLEMIICQKD